MARLKVFQTTSGFFETVVAAPSQKAALEAWGVRQNLFNEGMASVTGDPGAVKAALAHPGAIMRRAIGSKGAFEAGSAEPPAAPNASKGAAKARAKPADRSALLAAEKTLAALERNRSAELEDLAAQHEVLQAKEEAAEQAYRTRKRDLDRRHAAARSAYLRAGGRN